MKKSNRYTALAGLMVFLSCAVYAGEFKGKLGYLTDETGGVVRNSYGQCWHTGYWSPALAIAECDPELVKNAEAVAKPPVAQQPPAVRPAVSPEPVTVVHLSAAALFDFDRAELRPEGKKILLEKIVSGMKLSGPLLTITGHADRIGTASYNLRLSERRAEAVKSYLVQQGLPAEKLSASGKGSSEPDLQANTVQVCKGVRGASLIACLQPDRRVTVESAGR